ncbi:hypothetical protein SDC9_201489 [bioreactor metagenome]|uniref:Uncharacterized protein n=1 Tax=bioreactor metagenome TaxID=1076179 RepID=A0A645J2Y7_9ZZZZ
MQQHRFSHIVTVVRGSYFMSPQFFPQLIKKLVAGMAACILQGHFLFPRHLCNRYSLAEKRNVKVSANAFNKSFLLVG